MFGWFGKKTPARDAEAEIKSKSEHDEQMETVKLQSQLNGERAAKRRAEDSILELERERESLFAEINSATSETSKRILAGRVLDINSDIKTATGNMNAAAKNIANIKKILAQKGILVRAEAGDVGRTIDIGALTEKIEKATESVAKTAAEIEASGSAVDVLQSTIDGGSYAAEVDDILSQAAGRPSSREAVDPIAMVLAQAKAAKSGGVPSAGMAQV